MIPENIGLNISMQNDCSKCCPRKWVINCCCCRSEDIDEGDTDKKVNEGAKVIKPKPIEKKRGPLKRWLTS